MQKRFVAFVVVFFFVNAILTFRSLADNSNIIAEGTIGEYSINDRVIDSLRKHRGIQPGDPDFQRFFHARLSSIQKTSKTASTQRITLRRLEDSNNNIWMRPYPEWQNELQDARSLYLSSNELDLQSLEPLSVCGRETNVGTPADLALMMHTSSCPGSKSNKLLLLKGHITYGQTGNNLIEFLHALQFAYDNDVLLGIMDDSWAVRMLVHMWMAVQDKDTWRQQFEEAFCVKIFDQNSSFGDWSLVQWDDLLELGTGRGERGKDADYLTSKKMFVYSSQAPLQEYIAYQSKVLQTLFRNYNSGKGTTIRGIPVNDMCSGIKALFGNESNDAIYSVVHQRSLEGRPGIELMKRMAHFSGCDPTAALHMEADYIKSILRPLGMLNYPIVLITDGQDASVVPRLMNDPEIASKLRLVPEEATWVGGDITLAIMSNVFIGNPASSFSGFITKSRLALGFGHSYLFRAKNEKGEWQTVCGDTCVYDKRIMRSMS